MREIMRLLRPSSCYVAVVVLFATLSVAGTATAQDGTIQFSGGSVAAGIGYSWGSGTLTFEGTEHKFKVSGLSVVDVGVSSVEASGTVSNLKDLKDFNGNYTAVAAGAAIAGGGAAITMKNQNGVVIKARATTKGIQFNLSLEGVTFTLVD